MQLSIIIPNYNYADFVGSAIESALAVDWPNIEVIVVDNGSTDNSREVIENFRDRVAIIFLSEPSQLAACNEGFSKSTGDVIIFLDSDDMLHPAIGRAIARVWREGISKVQFQMTRINASGEPTGSIFPRYDPMPTPELIRYWYTTTTAYPTPPGSGNAYARSFLEKIFPLDDSCGPAPDSACLAAAPFLGDVVTVPKPLVFYRVHGRNQSNFMLDEARFGHEVAKAEARIAYTERICKTANICLSGDRLFKSLEVLQFRVASLRLLPSQHPLKGDSRLRALRETILCAWSYPVMSCKYRMVICIWLILTLLVPLPIARRLIALRFAKP